MDVLGINAAVLQHFVFDREIALQALKAAHLPAEIEGLSIDLLSSLFLTCQLFDRKSAGHFEKSSLREVVESQKRAARILSRFPHGVRSAVKRFLPAQHKGHSHYLYVHRIFGRLWRVLFFERSEQVFLTFLRKAFLDTLVSAWRGPFASNEYDLNAQFRSRWVALCHAKTFLSQFMHSAPVQELVRTGEIEGMIVHSRVSGRVELWVQRESLERWAEKQRRLLSQYVTIRSARKQLGLTFRAMQALVRARLVRIYHTEAIRGHPYGRYILRAQVEGILSAFDDGHVPEIENYGVGEMMALGDATWGLVGCCKGLPLVILAIEKGMVKAVGKTRTGMRRNFRGVMRYVFRTVDLIGFCRDGGKRSMHAAGDRPVSLKQAAELLKIPDRSVSELLRVGKLKYFVGFRSRGRYVLVSARSVDAFLTKFVRARDAAKQLSAARTDFKEVLREFSIPVVRFSETPGGMTFVRRRVLEQKVKQLGANLLAA